MKFVFILITSLIVLLGCNCTSNNLKNSNKNSNTVKGKRTTSEFFNELFTDSSKMKTKKMLESKFKDSNATISNQISKENVNSNSSILSDWLMISSPNFKDTKKFPLVTLHSGEKIEIQVDYNYFRINSGYINGNVDLNLPRTEKYFWFRLSGKNIYYSSTMSDLNVLGDISIRSIISVTHLAVEGGNGDACFIIQDDENQDWKLCANTVEIRNNWVCRIQVVIGSPLDPICSGGLVTSRQPDISTIIEKKVIQPIIVIPIPSPHCNQGWNYQQNGRDWQCDCSEGREQSPIDLPVKDKALDSPIKPLFQYEVVSVKSPITTIEGQLKAQENLKLQLVQNTLKIIHHNMGRVVTLDGAIYHAQEIVIHTPAEHTIDGKKYDMEVQIIHYGQTKGDIAKQVILSFLFEKKAGVYNKFIDDLDIFNLPNPLSKQVDLVNNIFIPKILYTSDDEDIAIMKPFSFYTYQGSITFPPCTEKTIMYVTSKPMPIGTTALQLLQEALRVPDIMNDKGDVIVSDWIPKNSRELQPLNGRPVFHYNHEKYCGPDPVKQVKPEGHYEKIQKSMVKYFYVNDMNPSGIPGAYVVSENEALGKDIMTIR
jgi:carbonic anhydrase